MNANLQVKSGTLEVISTSTPFVFLLIQSQFKSLILWIYIYFLTPAGSQLLDRLLKGLKSKCAVLVLCLGGAGRII